MEYIIKDDHMLELSKLLRKIRENKNYSQKEIAAKIGITQQMVSKIENCKGNPSLKTFLKYCDGIEINILDLIKEKYTLNRFIDRK